MTAQEKLDTGIIDIHGKQYHTVARRLSDFREEHPDWSITTELLEAGDTVRFRAVIRDHEGNIKATGHAEEIRGATTLLKTSAMEVCETSAVGRALGMMAKGGVQIASAEEMELALEQQKELAGIGRLIQHNNAVRDHLPSIMCIKESIALQDWSTAYEAFAELDPETVQALWVAPTKGGIFTTSERQAMKSNEWNDARKAHHGLPEDSE